MSYQNDDYFSASTIMVITAGRWDANVMLKMIYRCNMYLWWGPLLAAKHVKWDRRTSARDMAKQKSPFNVHSTSLAPPQFYITMASQTGMMYGGFFPLRTKYEIESRYRSIDHTVRPTQASRPHRRLFHFRPRNSENRLDVLTDLTMAISKQ